MSGNDETPIAKRTRRGLGRTKAIATTSSTMITDPSLWKNFPEELYESVMARVPITSFLRFRVVCQDWNSMPTSKTFFKLHAQVKQTKPWIYCTIRLLSNDGAIYDPESNKWYRPSFPPLPTNLPVEPVASAGGLVCLVDNEYSHAYIYNPIMGSLKELPTRSIGYGAVAMAASNDHSRYEVLFVSLNGEYEIYDSSINSWGKLGTLPSNIKRPLGINFKSRTVSIDGTHYFVRSNPDGILYYNVASGDWREISIPNDPFLRDDYTLAECGGKIMLVGLMRIVGTPSVRIWELHKLCMLWKLVSEIPSDWLVEFDQKPVELDFLSNKDTLMISIRSRTMYRLVMYDISTEKWSKPPRKIPSYGRRRPRIVKGTAFHPCLIGSV